MAFPSASLKRDSRIMLLAVDAAPFTTAPPTGLAMKDVPTPIPVPMPPETAFFH